MKKIGGFFELEIPKKGSLYHEDAIKLSTGRACLNYILKHLKPTKVFLPYYCCNALYEPMVLNNIVFEFYEIDESLELINTPILKPSEYIIYCDFFGIKSEYNEKLIEHYKDQLIIDNTHSFYNQGYQNNFSFTSARKYFGVPDGAFLYIPNGLELNQDFNRNTRASIDHNLFSLIGKQDEAFKKYLSYEKSLGSDIEGISKISENLLSNVNYQDVRSIRNKNYSLLFHEFKNDNRLLISKNEKDCFCYPLLLDKPIDKNKFYAQNIFVPNLWFEITERTNAMNYNFECKLSTELLPLPIDHRYNLNDMKRMIKTIRELMND